MFPAGPSMALVAAALLAFGKPPAVRSALFSESRAAAAAGSSGSSGLGGGSSGDWGASFCGGSPRSSISSPHRRSSKGEALGYSDLEARGWWFGNPDPTVRCYSNGSRAAFELDSTNGSGGGGASFGYFACPLAGDSGSLYCCCGSESEQFCCSVLEYTVTFYRTELLALVAAATLLFLWGLSSLSERKLRKPATAVNDAEGGGGSGGGVEMRGSGEILSRSCTCGVSGNLAAINGSGAFSYELHSHLEVPPYESPAPPPTYADATKNQNLHLVRPAYST